MTPALTSTTRSCRRAARASTAALGVAIFVVAAPAAAQEPAGGSVVLASFSGRLTGDLAALPERLTAAMADIVQDAGSKVTRAPLADLLAVAGCGEASDQCLEQARTLLEAGRVVAGNVESAGAGRVRVQLRLIAARQQPRRRTLLLAGSTPAALEAAFRARAATFWRDPAAPPAAAESRRPEPPRESAPPRRSRPTPPASTSAAPAAAPTDTTPPASSSGSADAVGPSRTDAALTRSSDGGFAARRVSPLAWGVAGGGAAVAAVGGVLLLLAADKQSQGDAPPTEPAADLDALVALEQSATSHARWGSVLLVVGAVSAAAGVALVFKQGNEEERDEPAGGALTLSPSALPGGAGAVLTWRPRP